MTTVSTGAVKRLISFGKSQYLHSLLIRVTNAALLLGVSVLLARLMGPEEYGKYGILLSFATILAIPFTAGLPRTMTRDIAAARVTGDFGKIRNLIRLGSRTFLALVPIVVVFAVSLWLAGYEVAGLSFGVLVAVALAPILSADENRMAIMRGLGSAIKSQVPDMLIQPLGTTVIVVTLLITIGQADAATGMAAYSCATLFGFVVGAVMVRNEMKRVPDVAAAGKVDRKYFFGSVATMSLLGSAGSLTGNIDMILLNHFAPYEAAGLYKVALAGLAVVVLGANAVSAVAFTRLAEVIPNRDVDQIAAYSDQALKWSILFTGGVTAVVFVIGRPMIELLYGSDYSGVWAILLILAVGFTVAMCFGQSPDIASLSGAQVPAAFCILLSVGLTATVTYFTYDALGPLGIAVGSMVGTISRYFLTSVIVRVRLGVDVTVFGLIARAMKNVKAQQPVS